MELDIRPTPTDEERAAVLAALELAAGDDGEGAAGSAWWEAGLPDADEADELP